MIPGKMARLSEEIQASAATMQSPRSDILIVTGNTQIDTIPPPFGGQVYGIQLILWPITAGNLVLSAAGNILLGITVLTNRPVWLVWSKSQQKWAINSGV
jgi:hypothetical protein